MKEIIEKGIDFLNTVHACSYNYNDQDAVLYKCLKNQYGVTEIRAIDGIIYYTDSDVDFDLLPKLTGFMVIERDWYLEIYGLDGEAVMNGKQQVAIHFYKSYLVDAHKKDYETHIIEDSYLEDDYDFEDHFNRNNHTL